MRTSSRMQMVLMIHSPILIPYRCLPTQQHLQHHLYPILQHPQVCMPQLTHLLSQQLAIPLHGMPEVATSPISHLAISPAVCTAISVFGNLATSVVSQQLATPPVTEAATSVSASLATFPSAPAAILLAALDLATSVGSNLQQ